MRAYFRLFYTGEWCECTSVGRYLHGKCGFPARIACGDGVCLCVLRVCVYFCVEVSMCIRVVGEYRTGVHGSLAKIPLAGLRNARMRLTNLVCFRQVA